MIGPRRPIAALGIAVAAAALAVAAGCGTADERPATESSPPAAAGQRPAEERSTGAGERHGAADAVMPSRCPPDLAGCRSAMGRIVYVERVDPDGDGDAHFVIADPQGITAGGLTAIDVRRALRPQPLPGIGDLISAAGPVQTGSYGQRQIHALELHVAR